MSASVSTPEGMRAINTLKQLLGKKLRVTLSDGRVAVGEFQCMDKQRNFILVGVEETMEKVDETTGVKCVVRRKLGLVMVPGKHLVKVEIAEESWLAVESGNLTKETVKTSD